jgi:sulfur carrier protein ThiS
VEIIRAAAKDRREVYLESGARVRDALHAVGLFAEATSALIDGRSVPLDRPLRDGERLEVVRTFSGG